jgi:hypothetical protein
MPAPDLPRWAHVPGTTPAADHARLAAAAAGWANARPGEARFMAGIDFGLTLLAEAFFWEAHECLEPLWQALPPNSRERVALRAIIQIANAGLKLRMHRPKAALRLLDDAVEALGPLDGSCLGIDIPALRRHVTTDRDGLKAGHTPDLRRLAHACIKMQETG